MNWVIIPNSGGSATVNLKIALRFIPLSQYLLRFFLLYPLSSKILKDTGKMTETAWVGAAYNMLLFYIASCVSLLIHAKWRFTDKCREYPQGETAPLSVYITL